MIASKAKLTTALFWALSNATLLVEAASRENSRRCWGHSCGRVAPSLLEVAAVGHETITGELSPSFWTDQVVREKNHYTYLEILSAIRGGADATDTIKSSSTSPSKTKKKKTRKEKSSPSAAKPSTASERVEPSTSQPIKEASPLPKKKPKVSKAARTHVQRDIKSTSPNYRIQRELKEFIRDPPPGLSVQIGKNLRVWIVTVEGPGIYKGETFRLRISFPPQYPTVPPSVYFLQPNIPAGPHFYTNGDICLSLLGKDWRPTMTAQSIAISILSMLASVQKKTLPMDNAAHAQNKPGQYQKDWVYHDDNA